MWSLTSLQGKDGGFPLPGVDSPCLACPYAATSLPACNVFNSGGVAPSPKSRHDPKSWPRHSQPGVSLSLCGGCGLGHVILAEPVEYKQGPACGHLCYPQGRVCLRAVNTGGGRAQWWEGIRHQEDIIGGARPSHVDDPSCPTLLGGHKTILLLLLLQPVSLNSATYSWENSDTTWLDTEAWVRLRGAPRPSCERPLKWVE